MYGERLKESIGVIGGAKEEWKMVMIVNLWAVATMAF